MRRTKTWMALGVVLVVGIAIGWGVTMLTEGTGTPSISNAQVEVGDTAPDFRLPDSTGGYVQLSDYRGKQNVVLAFYPAAWTPV